MDITAPPKVSIIIPVYNTGKYLRRCLASVCGQTLEEIEIICINDGSTDNSLEILRDHTNRDRRIVLIDQEHIGVASARNRGLEKASAPYIGFVDSDDFIAPDMYEKMYNAMIMNEVGFVECGAEDFYTYDPAIYGRQKIPASKDPLSGKVEDVNEFIKKTYGLWRILFKKEIITRYHLIFPEEINIHEDTLFIYSYKSLQQTGYYLPENLYMYFWYENSVMGTLYSKKQGAGAVERLKIIELYYSFLKTQGIYEEKKDIFWEYFISMINQFFQWTESESVRSTGIEMIRELLKNEDIHNLAEENNREFFKFFKSKESKLIKSSFLITNKRNIFREICKGILPYAIVRWIQESKRRKPIKEQ